MANLHQIEKYCDRSNERNNQQQFLPRKLSQVKFETKSYSKMAICSKSCQARDLFVGIEDQMPNAIVPGEFES